MFIWGLSSAWCADWAFKNYKKEDIVLYFNDTKWEHKDLYRFLNDLSKKWDHEITYDSDGRTPEQVFYDSRFLGSNRVPLCSKILKAERLQAYTQTGDTLIFGIGLDEAHRAVRLTRRYQILAAKTNQIIKLRYPIIEEKKESYEIKAWLNNTGIDMPYMYKIGFTHNNCSGGCVRAGKGQWKKTLALFPEVYADRERVEKEVSEYLGQKCTYMKDMSLVELREKIENHGNLEFNDDIYGECVGICDLMN